MFIPVILGTAREGRQSEKVARLVLEQVQAAGHKTELIDVRDYRIAATDNSEEIPEAKKLEGKIIPADSLIIIMPEYNHTYPGELKMMLDLIYKQYAGKLVGIIGVSVGPLGGARGVQALRLTCIGLGMYPLLEAVYFPLVQDLFDERGKIKDLAYEKRVQGLIKALVKKGEKK
jgi:NAD(P)H-dependent FMN reductase